MVLQIIAEVDDTFAETAGEATVNIYMLIAYIPLALTFHDMLLGPMFRKMIGLHKAGASNYTVATSPALLAAMLPLTMANLGGVCSLLSFGALGSTWGDETNAAAALAGYALLVAFLTPMLMAILTIIKVLLGVKATTKKAPDAPETAKV